MKLKTVNKISEIHFLQDGITLDGAEDESGIRRLILTTAAGDYLEIEKRSSYSECVSVSIPAPPNMVTKWMLIGEVLGLSVSESFDHEYEAHDRKNELSGHLDDSKFDLAVTEQQIPEV